MAEGNPDDLFREVPEDLGDPLAEAPEAGSGNGKGRRPEKQKKKDKDRKKDKPKAGQIVRTEDIDDDDDIDVAAVISTYAPARRARLLGLAILRLGRMRLALLAALLVVLILFIMSFMQEKMGNFTINLDRLELFRKGIAIDYDPYFSHPTARLIASPVIDATNISIDDLPANLDDINGDHNGINYMAYTYYLRNAGKEDVSYVATVVLEGASKDADDAVRVAIWRNGERTVYAKKAADGSDEPGCVSFESGKLVCSYPVEEFRVGDVDKYTVVIWLEGDDPECVDAIIGGAVEFTMRVAATNEDDTTLLWKWVQDIKDTLTGNKPINTAGTEAPDFQKYDNVNWFTRRNQ